MPEYTVLKGLDNISDPMLIETISTNFYFFLNWGLLEAGNYFNVRIPTSGAYGQNEHRLRPVRQQGSSATNVTVWESHHGSWVWESGIESQPTQPIRVSGVFINGVFNTVNYVDYAHGRVVLNSGINQSSTVTAEYSYRYINVYDANDVPWTKNVQYNSMRSDSSQYLTYGSGSWANLGETKVHLPAIIFEVQDGDFSPYALGGGTVCRNNIICHVLAENGFEADKIADILAAQYEKTIFLFDLAYLAESGVWPLDHLGRLNPGAVCYPRLVEPKEDGGFRWVKITFDETKKQNKQKINDNLYNRPVVLETSTVVTSI